MNTIRYSFLFIILLVVTANATEISLERVGKYTVPNGKIWLIDNVPPAECRVCTADVYVEGEVNNVEINGVVFSGNFNFSFSEDINGTIKLHAGTGIWLGDSRQHLTIKEVDDEH